MNKASKIIPGCKLGIASRCYYDTSFSTLSEASKSCSTFSSASSDTFLRGSFCPKRTGSYTILPLGTIRESRHAHKFIFNETTYQLNESISLSLKKDWCYSYYLYDCDYYSSSASIQITFANNKYVLSKDESITCQYTGFLPRSLQSCKLQRKHSFHSFIVFIMLL